MCNLSGEWPRREGRKKEEASNCSISLHCLLLRKSPQGQPSIHVRDQTVYFISGCAKTRADIWPALNNVSDRSGSDVGRFFKFKTKCSWKSEQGRNFRLIPAWSDCKERYFQFHWDWTSLGACSCLEEHVKRTSMWLVVWCFRLLKKMHRKSC